MEGFGNQVKSFLLDDKKMMAFEIPGNLTGVHSIKIVLANNVLPETGINKVVNHVSCSTPFLSQDANSITWQPVANASAYKIIKNGQFLSITKQTTLKIGSGTSAEYQVIAIDAKGFQSFASEPVFVSAEKAGIYEVEKFADKATESYKGFSGDGFVEIAKGINKIITIPITINETGNYSIDFRYANGNGPVNTENKCAIRTLKINGVQKATFVFPQRGKEEWSNWGFSNAVQIKLDKGNYKLELSMEDFNDNMNGDINQAMIDFLRITKL
jgi:hypothetical protein